jgi:hypothetical protein
MYLGKESRKINRLYSFSTGVPEALREEIKQVLEVSNESLSERYLGLPSDVGCSKNGCFEYFKDKV